jgi:phosphatidylglycerophosphate synthase
MSDNRAHFDPADRALRQAGILAAVIAAAQIMVLALVSAPAAFAGVILFLAVAVTLRFGVRATHPHDRFGAANTVTMIRAAAATGLVVMVTDPVRFADPALAWAVVAIAAATLALDGVDGWLARRGGLASAFGARFDMEVDSGFALILALGLLTTGKAGAWVLLLGCMRYLFVLAMYLAPWLDGPLPERQSRKTVCVVQIAALIALHAPVVEPPLSAALAAAATLAVVWSFTVDVVWLWRRR